MKIINQSKNTLLAEQVRVADTFWKRFKGLLGEKELQKGQALVLKPCHSIHTFFMRFPIDVLFVDKDNKVIKAISCLRPFRLSFIYFNASFAIELPAGVIHSSRASKGDALLLE